MQINQVRVQPPTSAINVTLLAFVAQRHAVERRRSTSRPPGPQQQTCRTPRLRRNMGQTDGQTNGHRIVTYRAAYYTSAEQCQ